MINNNDMYNNNVLMFFDDPYFKLLNYILLNTILIMDQPMVSPRNINEGHDVSNLITFRYSTD